MSHIKLDISNIHHEVLSIGASTNAACAKIREIIADRGLGQRDVTRLCEARRDAGLTDHCPSHQTVHKFLAGKSVLISYDLMSAMFGALGYELCATRTMITGDTVKIIDGGETSFSIPQRPDLSKNFGGVRRKKKYPPASSHSHPTSEQ